MKKLFARKLTKEEKKKLSAMFPKLPMEKRK